MDANGKVVCTAAGKQRDKACPKRFDCQLFKNFLDQAKSGELKNVDMNVFYKQNYQFKKKIGSTDCASFKEKNV